MSIKKMMEERKQVRILKKVLPELLAKIDKEQKSLLSQESILSRFHNGKLFGVAGTTQKDGYHINYKFTTGIHKLK